MKMPSNRPILLATAVLVGLALGSAPDARRKD